MRTLPKVGMRGAHRGQTPNCRRVLRQPRVGPGLIFDQPGRVGMLGGVTGEDLGGQGEPPGEAERRNRWLLSVAAIAVLIVAVGLVLVLGRGETHQSPQASAAPSSEPTSARTATTTPPPPTKATEWPKTQDSPFTGGSAWVVTPSGKTHCQVAVYEDRRPHAQEPLTNKVSCGVAFNFPTEACGVWVNADGDWDWFCGNAGNPDFITLEYGTPYRVLGWTIEPMPDGTTFTNDKTGHGMFVSVDRVETF